MTPAVRDTNSADATLTLLTRVTGITPEGARRLLATYGSLAALCQLDAATLRAHGLSVRQAARLHDAFDLAACLTRPPDQRPQVTSSGDVAQLVLPEMSGLESEQLRAVLLTTKNHVIATVTLYVGTIDTVTVRVAEIFRAAIRNNAASLILVHNHPSTDPRPSLEDIAMTRTVVEAGDSLNYQCSIT